MVILSIIFHKTAQIHGLTNDMVDQLLEAVKDTYPGPYPDEIAENYIAEAKAKYE